MSSLGASAWAAAYRLGLSENQTAVRNHNCSLSAPRAEWSGGSSKTSISIAPPAAQVWDALVKPDLIKQYMFGTTVSPDFEEGGPITWKGEWKGKAYEDKGTILKVEPRRRLQYSHCSPLSGVPDTPENRHTDTIELTEARGQTRVDLSQDNNASEESREHSEKNWRGVLEGLKRLLESTAPGARTLMV